MDPSETTLETAPTSKRFPTTNQAKACYMYYNSWHQCKYDYSDEEPQCAKLKGWAMSMCPIEWVRATPPPADCWGALVHRRRAAPLGARAATEAAALGELDSHQVGEHRCLRRPANAVILSAERRRTRARGAAAAAPPREKPKMA